MKMNTQCISLSLPPLNSFGVFVVFEKPISIILFFLSLTMWFVIIFVIHVNYTLLECL